MQTLEYKSSTDSRSPALLVVANVLFIYPLLFVTFVYVFWLLTWLELGHRPSLYEKTFLLGLSNSIRLALIGLMLGLFPAFAGGVIANFAYSLQNDERGSHCLWRFIPFTSVWLATFVLFNADPGGVFAWWMN